MDKLKLLNDRIKEKNGKLYYVGGYVRDKFLNRESKDIDLLVSGLDEKDLNEILINFSAKICGKSFEVNKVNIDGIEYDIAVPRIEISTGSGHQDFKIIKAGKEVDIIEDLKRRDFTINAMAQDFETGKIIDPFDGQKDLKNRKIKQITDNSIFEDYLRALRAIQFAARFNFIISKQTIFNIIKYKELIKTLSAERIQIEFNKLLQSDNIIMGFNYLKQTGLLDLILPEVSILDSEKYNYMYHKYNTYYHTLHSLEASEKDLELRLAILLHDIGKHEALSQDDFGIYHNYNHEIVSAKIAREVLKRLKYNNKTIDNVIHLIENHMQPVRTKVHIKRMMSKYDYELTKKIYLLIYYDKFSSNSPMSDEEFNEIFKNIDIIKEQKEAIKISDLHVNGYDMVTLGLKGKEIGEMLKYLLDIVIEKPENNNQQILLQLANEKISS